MYETVIEVDEKKITKENIMLLTRDHTTTLKSGHVEDICEIKNH